MSSPQPKMKFASLLEGAGKAPRGYGVTCVAQTMKNITRGGEFYADERSLDETNGAFAKMVTETLEYIRATGELGMYEEAKEWDKPHWAAFLGCTRLMCELQRGGCVDSSIQGLFLTYMALGEETVVSKIRLSELTAHTEMWVMHINDFLKVKFDITNSRGGKVIHSVSDEEKEEADSLDEEMKSDKEEEDEEEQLSLPNSVVLRCVGLGYTSIAKRMD